MKFALYYFQTQKEKWAEQAAEVYVSKINRMESFDFIALKSPSADRDQALQKLANEAKSLLNKIDASDELILFDPAGKQMSSEEFSHFVQSKKESGRRRVCFVVGGAYGFADEVKKRAQSKVSFSPMVFNHHVALTVSLEQIYRAMTIQRNLPYHNGSQ